MTKSLNYCRNYQNVTQKYEVNKRCWENGAGRHARCRGATDLQCVETAMSAKRNKAKHSKMRYVCIDSHAAIRNDAES